MCLLFQALDFSIQLKTSDFVGAKTLSPVSAGRRSPIATRFPIPKIYFRALYYPLLPSPGSFLHIGPHPLFDKYSLSQEEFKTLLTDGGLCPAQNLSLDRHGASFDAAVAGVCHVARLAGQLSSKSNQIGICHFVHGKHACFPPHIRGPFQ